MLPEMNGCRRAGGSRIIEPRTPDGANMDLQSFRQSTANPEPPAGLGFALQALWWDAKGDWDKAHECAQARDDDAGMSVHAYLHRKEGDLSNAGYWYRRCGRPPATVTLEQEWQALAEELLGAA
jgi:hypothetical protein